MQGRSAWPDDLPATARVWIRQTFERMGIYVRSIEAQARDKPIAR